MKKNYTRLFMVIAIAFAIAQSTMAQSPWKAHKAAAPTNTEAQTLAATSGNIYIGHCSYDSYIYEYDGLSLDRDARVGVGVKLPRALFEKYIGGSITAIRCGWDDGASTATYECFIRNGNFGNEDIATGKGSVRFGWNEVKLTTPLSIPDTDTLCVGFYTNLKKGVCSIPKFYPTHVPNSSFLFHGETTADGKEIWYDSRDLGMMPIMLKITDSSGQFNNLVDITGLRYDQIVKSDIDNVGLFNIKNSGSNNISSLELTASQGGKSLSTTIELTKPIETGLTSKVKLPIHCFGTGETKISLTKVNGVEPTSIPEYNIYFIGVPEATAQQYTHKPLIEFYASENLYHIPSFFDDIFMLGYEPYKDQMNVVCQHTDDKFMIGDPDEAILMLLEHVNNDSMKVYVPTMTVNRTAYASSPDNLSGTPMHQGILYPTPLQEAYYEDVIAHPTFASVNIDANIDESGEKVSILVSGDIAAGIMPADEPLFLTVYLIEREVVSYDQKFWDDKEAAESTNRYVHYNVIRENLTPMWGKQLSVNSGSYSMTFNTDIYSDYNADNLGVIAFINRGKQNSNLERQIINSAEAVVKNTSTGIQGVEADATIKNSLWYDLSGRRILAPQKGGIYIKDGQKVILK